MKDFVLRKWQYDDADSISIVANNPNIAQNLRNTFPSPYTIDDDVFQALPSAVSL